MRIKFKIKPLHCLWLLGNVDESILKLSGILEHGFEVIEIDHMSDEFKTIQKLERLEDHAGISNRLSLDYHCLLYTKVYGIYGVFDVPVDHVGTVRFDKIDEDIRDIIRDYVPSFVSKIRLFKEGNLRIPVSYTYFKNEDEIRLKTQNTWLKSEFTGHFALVDSELPKLKIFMHNLKIPFNFERPFLQSAFDLFEMSYYTFNYDIRALILFMGLEVLFKSGKSCKSPCIAENIASFLGDDQQNYEELYCEILSFWRTRNDIAHEGSSGLTPHYIKELVKSLRKYVRDSIIKIDNIGKDKDKIMEDLKGKFNRNKINCTE